MKTKHLFLATALVASFAACTNEEFAGVQQDVFAEGARPTVENVRFNFVGEGLDSRLTFGGDGYAWEATDTIGALNMDVPTSFDNNAAWLNKYELKNYVNTSYPFTYDEGTATWVCPGKMLEGNYFFAFPFSNYNGSRQVKYSFFNQEQDGLKGAVVAKNYAKNQVFIGYAQIKSGDKIDMVKDLEMTSILGALQLRIKNTGEGDLYINKIVLRQDDIENELTFDPTNAEYTAKGKAYDLTVSGFNGTANWFNYANYVGDEEAKVNWTVVEDGETITKSTKVYQIDETITDKEKKYNHEAAIRSVVNYKGDKNFVQLTVNGTKAERTIAEGETGYALIMVNPLVKETGFSLDIYTDNGILSYPSLEKIADETTLTVAPGVSNTIVVEADAKDLKSMKAAMDIYSNEELQQYISWNIDAKKATTLTATLHKNVTLTNAMVELLQSNDKLTLKIQRNSAEKLTIAADVAEDVLDYEGLVISSVPVEIKGAIEVTDETQTISSLTILKGASLSVVANKAVVPTSIINKGTLTIAKGIKVATGSITNKVNATMIVEESADVAAAITNEKATKKTDKDAILDVYGYVSNVTNNGVVNMKGASAKFAGVSQNNGIINTIANAEVAGTNNAGGEIVYVENAVITATNNGYVSYVIAEATTVTKDSFKDQKINKLNVKNATLTVNDAVTRFTVIDLYDKATLSINKDKSLTANLVVKGAEEDEASNVAYVIGQGSITGKVTVEENAKLVNSSTIYASAAANDFKNEGIVENTGTVQVLYDADVTTLSTASWYYVAPVSKSNAAAVKAAALKDAVIEYLNVDKVNYVADGYKVLKTTFDVYLPMKKGDASFPKATAYANAYTTATQAEIDAAVASIATDNTSALVTALGNVKEIKNLTANSTYFEPTYKADGTTVEVSAQLNAYAAIVEKIVKSHSDIVYATDKEPSHSVALAATKLTAAQIAAFLEAQDKKTVYVWEDCNLEKAIKVWKKYDAANLLAGNNYSDVFDATTHLVKSGVNANSTFVAWALAALKMNDSTLTTELNNAGVTLAAMGEFKAYTNGQYGAVNKGMNK